jgi:lysophospholipase L1-like esterase
MIADGVENIIYLYYPDFLNTMAYMNPMVSYGRDEIIIKIGTNSKIHFIDPRTAFVGHPEYFKSDDLHPTKAGGKAYANLIWNVLESINK